MLRPLLALLALGLGSAAQGQPLYYIHTDHLNTPRMVTDGTGTAVWRWDQVEPFGDNPPDEDPDGNSTLGHMPLRLPGQYFDKETNLAYNYFRDYDAGIGRYVQSDPIGLGGGLNTYAYAGGTPLTAVDPTGELVVAIAPALPAIGSALAKAGVAVVGLVAGMAIGDAISSSGSGESGAVPGTGQAANDPRNPDCPPDDCPERQKKLEVRYGAILLMMDKGYRMTIAREQYNREARAHNKRCPTYPVPTFIDVVK